MIGGLIYLNYTRPYKSFVVNYLSRFMQEPKMCHWKLAKRVLRHIHGTMDHGLEYKRNYQFFLTRYKDADYAGLVDDRKSTFGFFSFLGSSPISWGNKKQATVTHSSRDVEYCTASAIVCEAVWLHHILEGLGVPQS